MSSMDTYNTNKANGNPIIDKVLVEVLKFYREENQERARKKHDRELAEFRNKR
jgi:hypothetical protein